MAVNGFDPEILQDFLTESGELLDQLEGDLVDLEGTPEDPDLVNKAFRALHTIKGSASFLALGELVEVAHAAESALNAARNAQAQIDNHMMDLLLRAVDTIKVQMDEIGDGSEALSTADPEVVSELARIGEGKASGGGGDTPPADAEDAQVTSEPEAAPEDNTPQADPDGRTVSPLNVDSSKGDLLDYFISDLESQIADVAGLVDDIHDDNERAGAVEKFREIGKDLSATVGFFDVDPMQRLCEALCGAAEHIPDLPDPIVLQVRLRMRAIITLLTEQAEGLKEQQVIARPTDTLIERISSLAEGGAPDPSWTLDSLATSDDVFRIDGVLFEEAEASAPDPASGTPAPQASAPDAAQAPAPAAAPAPQAKPAGAPAQGAKKEPAKGGEQKVGNAPEATIRVEVGRLEALMNLVGELVLQKNRITEISGRVNHTDDLSHEVTEQLGLASETLSRVTGDIQVAVMRTRMQPLDKLFGKYPRLIRDLAQKTGKKIQLVVEGGETEVDRSVIEELGDPLIHIMRNSADHGLENPEERVAAGKPESGTIILRAAQHGDHVLIDIIDDGRGLSRERIGAKAIERGLTTQAEVDALSDDDVAQFIFLPGFSTAGEVSDLSGRGVGMDVVRTNINKIKGTISVRSKQGEGTRISISIPLTVAIMPAMMVHISSEIYAVPLGSIVEIVRPQPEQMSTIIHDRVLRVRGQVIPLVDSNDVFRVPRTKRVENPMALILSAGNREVGLLVSGVIGQQEIVIKPLDGVEKTGPVSGATVRNDGGVSLIVDVAALMRCAEDAASSRATPAQASV